MCNDGVVVDVETAGKIVCETGTIGVAGKMVVEGHEGKMEGYDGRMGVEGRIVVVGNEGKIVVEEPLNEGFWTHPQEENLIVTTAFDSRPAESLAMTVTIKGDRAQSTLLGVPCKTP